MFYHIIKNLYPIDSVQIDKLPSTDFIKILLDSSNEKMKSEIEKIKLDNELKILEIKNK